MSKAKHYPEQAFKAFVLVLLEGPLIFSLFVMTTLLVLASDEETCQIPGGRGFSIWRIMEISVWSRITDGRGWADCRSAFAARFRAFEDCG